MQTPSGKPVKLLKPGLAALLGGGCIGAGLLYVRMKKTAAACIALAVFLVWAWFQYHILWLLWMLAVLWYWQMWIGYDKAEEFNDELVVTGEPPW
jgi:hypothetical protein